MRKYTYLLIAFVMIFGGCAMDGDESYDDSGAYEYDLVDGADGDGGGEGSGNGIETQAGLITAAEWNDLDQWSFWREILQKEDFKGMPAKWSLFTNNRVTVSIKDAAGNAQIGARVNIQKNGEIIWESRTDSEGHAELWLAAFQLDSTASLYGIELYVEDQLASSEVKFYSDEVNQLIYDGGVETVGTADIALVVDATGSMADELEFLKQDLIDVIDSVSELHQNVTIRTGAVFYRDKTDAYLTRTAAFSEYVSETHQFISEQSANGGGDYPEAVDAALIEAMNGLQWQSDVKILFLLLDAPPHDDASQMSDLRAQIKLAAANGVRIIPIAASGVDKETEFFCRQTAILTNGTYVFITNDSGIGLDHIEASVGEYQVELLNELMVRLIGESLE